MQVSCSVLERVSFMVTTLIQRAVDHLIPDVEFGAVDGFENVPSTRQLDVGSFFTPRVSAGSGNRVLRSDDCTLMVVADGFGNEIVDEIAVSTVMEVLCPLLLATNSQHPTAKELRTAINEALSEANAEIVRQVREYAGKSTGCSIVVTVHVANYVMVKAVGDCRAYLLRNGHLTQLTQDQTLTHLLTSSGQLSPLMQSNRRNVLLNCLGSHDFQPNDEFTKLELSNHDRLLLTDRGLTSVLTHSDIRTQLGSSATAADAAETLGCAAVDRGETRVACLTMFAT